MLIFALLIAILVGGVLQRITGIGFALIIGSFVVLLFGAYDGVPLVNVLAAANGGLALLRVYRDVDWKRFAIMAGIAIAVMLPSVSFIANVSGATLEVWVGLFVIAGMSIILVAPQAQDRLWRPGAIWPLALSAVIAGIGGVVAGASGPPLAAYAVLERWDPRRFAATMQPFFIVTASFAVLSKLLLTSRRVPQLALSQWVMLATALVIATIAGDWLAKRVSRETSRRILIALAYLGGLATLLRGVGLLPN